MESRELKVDFCYYGMRETLVTHIRNVQELASQLGSCPEKIKVYFAEKLQKEANIEGKTLKIKGLIIKPVIDTLIAEYNSYI
jgi:translation initiation factor 2 beta subunit (eIF-2beta)/eIF-5